MDFHHHPDGKIFIHVDGKNYRATVANFQTDVVTASLPVYDMPSADEVRYKQGVFHRMKNGTGARDAAMPWDDGDDYLAGIDALITARAAREDPGPPPPPVDRTPPPDSVANTPPELRDDLNALIAKLTAIGVFR